MIWNFLFKNVDFNKVNITLKLVTQSLRFPHIAHIKPARKASLFH